MSLYNQNPDGAIDPTPTVAMVGIIERREHITTQWFKDEGDAIILLGDVVDAGDPLLGLGGSAYLQKVHCLKTGTPPRCDLDQAKTLHDAVRSLIYGGSVKSAHDCSEGGLAVALAEGCISQQVARETPRLIGARVDLSSEAAPRKSAAEASERSPEAGMANARLDALLFGETQNRIVITASALHAGKVLARQRFLASARRGWERSGNDIAGQDRRCD